MPPAPAPASGPGSAPASGQGSVSGVIEHLGAALTVSGLPRAPARVFAALLVAEDGRRTAGELSSTLEASPAAISGAVRYLEQIRLLRRERVPGSRKDVFVVMDDAWHDMMLQADQLYAAILVALREAESAVGPDTRAGRRLGLSVEFLDFIQTEMAGVVERWEAHKRTRRDGIPPR